MYRPPVPDSWGNAPTQPSRSRREWSPPTLPPPPLYRRGQVGPGPDSGGYVPLRTEREEDLARRLALAEGRASALEGTTRRLEGELNESRQRLYQWRINIRNGFIVFLTLFIAVWASVSVLVRYPVLPWDMPGAILSLLGH